MFGLTPVTTRIATFQIDGVTVGLLRTVGAGILARPILLFFRLQPPRCRLDQALLPTSAMGGLVGFPLLFSIGSQQTSIRWLDTSQDPEKSRKFFRICEQLHRAAARPA